MVREMSLTLDIALVAVLVVSSLCTAQDTTLTTGPVQPLWEARYDVMLPTEERSVGLRVRGTTVYSLALSASTGLEPQLVVSAWDSVQDQMLWQRHVSGPTYTFASPIGDLDVSADGARVYVTSSRDANLPEAFVAVIDGLSGALLAVWTHGTPLTGFQRTHLSPDGALLYAVGVSPVFSGDDVVCAFATNSGQLVWSQPVALGINSIVPGLGLSADGARLYVSGEHGLEARHPGTGVVLWSRTGPTYDFAEAAVGLVAQANQNEVVLCASASGAPIQTIALPNRIARAVVFDPAGADLLVATRSTTSSATSVARYTAQGALVWNAAQGGNLTPQRLLWTPAAGAVPERAWLCGLQNASGSFVRVITPSNGGLIGSVSSAAVATSGGAEPLIDAGPSPGEVVYSRALPSAGTDVSCDRIDSNGQVGSGFAVAFEQGAAEQVLGAAASSDGHALVFASTASAGVQRVLVRRVAAESGALQWQFVIPGLAPASNQAPQALANSTRRFARSSDGQRVYITGWIGSHAAVVAVDSSTGAVAWTFQGPTSTAIFELEPLAGGTRIALATGTASSAGTFALDAATGFPLWNVLEGGTPPYYDACPRVRSSPDGTRVLSARTVQIGSDYDLALRLRDAANGALAWSLDLDHAPGQSSGLAQELTALAVDPGGQRYFAAARLSSPQPGIPRSAIYAIDASSGAVLWETRFDSVQHSYFALALRPDGQQLALAARPPAVTGSAPVHALDAATGVLQWSLQLPAAELGSYRARYDTSGAKLYLGQSTWSPWTFGLASGAHGVRALSAATGSSVWTHEVDSADAAEEVVNALLALESPRRLYALGSNASGGFASDVFIRALDLPALTQDVEQLSLASGGSVQFELDAGPELGGAVGWLAGSASGTQPGIALDNVVLPLVPDAYFAYFVQAPNQGYLHGTLGAFDVHGHRQAALVLPAGGDAALAGLVLQHAYVALDLALPAVVLASEARSTTLMP
jgi:outer membrane protein assembly factor BamB